jgi:rod shape-determining protein MreC
VHDAKRTRPVLILLLIVAIALITLDFRDGGSSPAHKVGAAVFGPVERLAGAVTSPMVSLFHTVSGNDRAEIAALQKQNDQLRAQLAESQLDKQEAAQLSQLLRLTTGHRYRIVAATVIAAGGAYSDTVTLNAGSRDGIAPNETVLNGDGLVGTVTATTATTATVLLATDVRSTVGVRMSDTNQIGALAGTGDSLAASQELRLTLFSATAALSPGQTVVTFGSVGGRPYVPGVPVGEVTTVTSQPGSLTQTAMVRPFADFTGLGVVGVVTSR